VGLAVWAAAETVKDLLEQKPLGGSTLVVAVVLLVPETALGVVVVVRAGYCMGLQTFRLLRIP
jgi:hypothetical protein